MSRSKDWHAANKERANTYSREYYQRNKERIQAKKKEYYARPDIKEKEIERQSQRRRDGKTKAVEHFGNKCHDCSGSFPNCVYDFHHLDPTQKDVTPGHLMSNTWENILQELEKCVMLCSNCHRIRHHVPT